MELEGMDELEKQQTEAKQKSCCVPFGNTRILCSVTKQYGMFPFTCLVGPHWYCMLFTYALIVGPIAFFFIHTDIHVTFHIILAASIALTSLTFTMVACSNPGIVFKDYEPVRASDDSVICARCHIRRPSHASHCYECNVCIEHLDHHCPWTGKCIGKRTLYWFYAFLLCITVNLIITGLFVVTIVFDRTTNK